MRAELFKDGLPVGVVFVTREGAWTLQIPNPGHKREVEEVLVEAGTPTQGHAAYSGSEPEMKTRGAFVWFENVLARLGAQSYTNEGIRPDDFEDDE